jgi:hypothetical protein
MSAQNLKFVTKEVVKMHVGSKTVGSMQFAMPKTTLHLVNASMAILEAMPTLAAAKVRIF